jgi:putative two-component system hydrogenase maturation factor HypX/HoxX
MHMRILLISSAYNSMTQRVHVELADRGHEVSVELALGDEVMRGAVRRCDPHLIVAPMLTAAIPADIWSARPCFIVHPGPPGDRGPSSLDWAIMEGAGRWGVTILQANAEMDAGDIWASTQFAMLPGAKSSLYRTEVADAALEALLLAVARFEAGGYRPEPLDYSHPGVTGRLRPQCRQEHRRIDWQGEPTASVLAKLRAADSRPGVLDVIGDTSTSCTAAMRKTSCEVTRVRSWPAGTALSAGRPRTARSGSRSCAAAPRPAVRRPSSSRPRWRSAPALRPCRRRPRR